MILLKRKYISQGRGIALLTLFLINTMIIGFHFIPTSQQQNNLAVKGSPETINSVLGENRSNPSTATFEKVNSWWNETFRYRIEINITEPGVTTRENDPVTIWLSFDEGVHRENSTRIAKYEAGIWTKIPCQVWNWTKSGSFITKCSITFMVSITKSQSVLYFVYYTDEIVNDETAEYKTETGFSATCDGSSVIVDNGKIAVQLANQTAFNSLKFSGEVRNYHTNSALAPSSALPSKEPILFTPTATTGFIMNWLICGAFIEDNYNTWVNFQTNLHIDNDVNKPWRDFVDVNKSYVEGDYASGQTVNSTYVDTTKRWTAVNFSDSTGIVNLNTYFSAVNWRSAYALAYVYSPVDQPDTYIKVMCDDSIRVYLDGNLVIDKTGVLRSMGSTDYDHSDPFTLKSGWTRVLVMCGENTGDWGFRLRFSSDDTLRSYTSGVGAITYLKIAREPVSFIDSSIDEKANGPVFAQFNYQWADSEDMKAWDNVTFYQSINMYKVERKLWFSKWHTTNPRNNSFAALNTFYSGERFDEYIYDGQTMTTGLQYTNFQVSNYTIIRDRSGDNDLTTLGVFITNLTTGNQYLDLTSLKWKVTYDTLLGVVNFLPGNWTDFDNKGTYSYENIDDRDKYIKVTFWEFLKEDVGDSGYDAHGVVDSVYQGLKNPLEVEIYRNQNESLFFNLKVTVKDLDGHFAPNVNVTLINCTDNNGWDFTWEQQPEAKQSLKTDVYGVAQFVRLAEGRYTVNLTYAAYEHLTPVNISKYEWGQLNVTLDKSQDILVENVSLTKLSLTFRQYDPTDFLWKGMINGGNVTFYTNVSNNLEKIGSIYTDVNGLAEFYWVSYNESIANTTFKIEVLGQPRLISYNETAETGDFVGTITLPMANESFHSIGVQIGEFSTHLYVLSSSLDKTHTYGDSLTVTVNYTYTYENAEKPIDEPTVTYSLSSTDRGVFNTGSFVYMDSPGVYSFTFASDASELELHAETSYTMNIMAERGGYTPHTNQSLIVLNNITTSIVRELASYQIYWNDNVTIRIRYIDTYNANDPIPGALVKYQDLKRYDTQGVLVEEQEHPGWYNLTLNSTDYIYASTYTLMFTAWKDNYRTTTTTVELQIQEIQTYIGTWLAPNQPSIMAQETVNVNVTTSLLMYFNYTTETGIGLPDAAVARYDWQDPSGNKGIGFLTDAGNGIYNLDFGTASKPLGKYLLIVRIGQSNYVLRQAWITIYIVEKPIVMTPVGFTQGETVKRPQGEDITISVNLYDPVAKKPLVGATVVLFFDGQNRTMTPSNTTPGEYYIVISTGTYNALFTQIDFASKIYVTMANYTQGGEFLFTIAIAPPEWFGIPQIYWIMIIATASILVGIFAIMKGVQYARVPQFVRDLRATRILIRKGKSVGRESVAENRGDSISNALENRYASLGMTAADKFAPKSAKTGAKTSSERKPEEEVA